MNTFNSRETYIAWRTNWKKRYAELSKEIRALKNSIKNQHRSGGCASYETWADKSRTYIEACAMLESLKAAKIEANRQYHESKKEVA